MRKNGFVLPLALVVLVAVSLLATTALQLALSDFRANRGARNAARALFAAEAGAHSILANWGSGPYSALSPGDSVYTGWTDLPDGSSYQGLVLRVDDGVDDNVGSIYRMVAEGRPSRREMASRTVTLMLIDADSPDLCCDAAVIVDGRIRLNGPANNGNGKGKGKGKGKGNGNSSSTTDSLTMVDGRDHIPTQWASYCPSLGSGVAGVALTDSDDLDLRNDVNLEGSPEVSEDATIGPDVVLNFGGWTYDALVARADLTISGNNVRYRDEIAPSAAGGVCEVSDTLNWGAPGLPGSACWTYLPIIHADGTLRIEDGGVGQGLLLVDGDLRLSEDFHFYGVAIVKGRAFLEDEARITGGLIVGNDGSTGKESELSDSSLVRFSSCAVARATADLAGVELLPGRFWFEIP
jgi:hypothetical protein